MGELLCGVWFLKKKKRTEGNSRGSETHQGQSRGASVRTEEEKSKIRTRTHGEKRRWKNGSDGWQDGHEQQKGKIEKVKDFGNET
jgi:hypothetical protein